MNITSYLPSRKVQIFIGSLLAIGFGFLIVNFINNRPEKTPETVEDNFVDVALVKSNDANTEYYVDTDNDGAYDWEEKLWPELDPLNPDSDGDGVLDGRYIQNKRDIQEKERRGTIEINSNLTETQKLGRSLTTSILAVDQSGAALSGTSEEQFSDNVATYINTLTLGEKLYTRDQLKLVENTKGYSTAYSNEMTSLFKTYPVATSDMELLITAVETPDVYKGQLRSTAGKYEEYLSELISVEVPYIIAGRHTELVNNVSQIGAGLNNLIEDEPDEVVSLAILVQVEDIMNQTADAIIKINAFFEIIDQPNVFDGE